MPIDDHPVTFALIGLTDMALSIALHLTDQGYTVLVLDDDPAALRRLATGQHPTADKAAMKRAHRGNKLQPALTRQGINWLALRDCDAVIVAGERCVRVAGLSYEDYCFV